MGGKVLLGELVTVSMNVPEGATYNLSVAGSSVSTTTKNGVATATFTVTKTGALAVTCDAAYSVSGATFTAVTGNGTVSGTAVADGEGKFSLTLTNGTFYLTAATDTLVSGAVEVIVNGAAVENKTVTPTKAKLIAGGSINYNLVTGNAVSNGADNNGATFVGGTIESGNAFVIKASIAKFTNDWYSAGFEVGIGNKIYRFVMRKSAANGVNGNCYDMVAWHSTTDQPAISNNDLKTNPFTQTGETADIALVYSNGKYYFFINGTLCNTVEEDNGTESVRLALFCEKQITYTDWGYSTDISGYDIPTA